MVVTYDMIGEGERNVDKKSRANSHDKQVVPPDGVAGDGLGAAGGGVDAGGPDAGGDAI